MHGQTRFLYEPADPQYVDFGIQSAFRMDSDKKESSELASLMLTKDFIKKIIVRMDVPHNFYDDNGIYHCNLIDLLLNRVQLF